MSALIRDIATRIWIPKKGTRRLFVAIPAPEPWKNALSRLKGDLSGFAAWEQLSARWVPDRNYHMTIRFIGAVDRACVANLTEVLSRAIAEESGFILPFSGIRIATPSDPKMIWAVCEDAPEFTRLVRRVTGAVASFLIRECHGMTLQNGHDIIPHVTVARMKRSMRMRSVQSPGYVPQEFPVTTLVLYESETRPTGSVYHELKRFRLKPANRDKR